ncbi:Uncharacterised protein [Bordetella pertussis]|nr:Uncharacterised protein [Bordetella pertussis]
MAFENVARDETIAHRLAEAIQIRSNVAAMHRDYTQVNRLPDQQAPAT